MFGCYLQRINTLDYYMLTDPAYCYICVLEVEMFLQFCSHFLCTEFARPPPPNLIPRLPSYGYAHKARFQGYRSGIIIERSFIFKVH